MKNYLKTVLIINLCLLAANVNALTLKEKKRQQIPSICEMPPSWEGNDHFMVKMNYNRRAGDYLDGVCNQPANLEMAKNHGEWMYKGAVELCDCVKTYIEGDAKSSVSNGGGYQSVIQQIINDNNLKDIDKYDIQEVKLGMSLKEATKIIEQKGYKRGTTYYRVVDGKRQDINFEYTEVPQSNKFSITGINYKQKFPTSMKLDLRNVYDQLIDKNGSPKEEKWASDKSFDLRYTAGDAELFYRVSVRDLSASLTSDKFEKALTDAGDKYTRAAQEEAEKRKPTATPDI